MTTVTLTIIARQQGNVRDTSPPFYMNLSSNILGVETIRANKYCPHDESYQAINLRYLLCLIQSATNSGSLYQSLALGRLTSLQILEPSFRKLPIDSTQRRIRKMVTRSYRAQILFPLVIVIVYQLSARWRRIELPKRIRGCLLPFICRFRSFQFGFQLYRWMSRRRLPPLIRLGIGEVIHVAQKVSVVPSLKGFLDKFSRYPNGSVELCQSSHLLFCRIHVALVDSSYAGGLLIR